MDEYLSIAAGAEGVASGFQTCGKFPKVVDLAVEDDLDGTVFISQRLGSALEVNDRQPTVYQSHTRGMPDSLAIWAAVRNGGTHCPKHGGIDRPSFIRV
jgi:hypothetical protein